MPGRGRGNQRNQAATPGDVKPDAADPGKAATQSDLVEEKSSGEAKGRGRGAQAAGKLEQPPSDELVEKMKQSLELKSKEVAGAEGASKAQQQASVSIAEQPEAHQSSAQSTRRPINASQDVPAVTSTFNPKAPPFVPSGKYDLASHAFSRATVSEQRASEPFNPPLAPPTTRLNANAEAFVPSFSVPDVEVVEEDDDYLGGLERHPQDPGDPYTVPVIIRGFGNGLDERGVGLLKLGAEILVNCTLYPATYERLQHRLRNMLSPSAQLALNKLCEMIVVWALKVPDFRIMASKICEVLFEQAESRRMVLQSLKLYCPAVSVVTSEDEAQQLIACTMFCAEVFSRVRMDNNPVWILGATICDYLDLLLTTNSEVAVYAVCNVLKLTGTLLQLSTTMSASVTAASQIAGKLPMLMERLKGLTTTRGILSSQCVEVMKRVVSLYNHNWGQPSTPDTSLRENPLQVESKHDLDTTDVPVRNPGDWEEYYDPEHGSLEQPSYVAGQAEHHGPIDSDVEEEFEQFIEEIEDFLMKQDMGEPLDEEER